MRRAYGALHRAGLAHSIEVWMDGELAGGIYGVALGRMFFGESMFSRRTDGSKIAIAHLAAQLDRWGFPLIDCQIETDHLVSLGAASMSRRRFVTEVDRLTREPAPVGTRRRSVGIDRACAENPSIHGQRLMPSAPHSGQAPALSESSAEVCRRRVDGI